MTVGLLDIVEWKIQHYNIISPPPTMRILISDASEPGAKELTDNNDVIIND